MTEAVSDPAVLAARLPGLRRRSQLRADTRRFFETAGYMEVETPYAVPAPGEEVHVRAFATGRMTPDGRAQPLWLNTSPEFAMKKLLAAGSGPIFQMARVWRNGEDSETHLPEFTMLEWYRPGATMDDLIVETENYLKSVLPASVSCRGIQTDLSRFDRITVAEAFSRYVGADLLGTLQDAPALAAQSKTALRAGEDWEDLFFRLLLTHIEPKLGRERPTFLTHFPAPQAALAQRDPDDPRVALRFELFCCGLELANAFQELGDDVELRARFTEDRARRHALYGGADWPIDEAFLRAAPHMPACSGIALGFDRLAMIAAGALRVTDVVAWDVARLP